MQSLVALLTALGELMYNLIAVVITVLLSPILIPLGLYIGLTYNWESTVPSDEDLDYE